MPPSSTLKFMVKPIPRLRHAHFPNGFALPTCIPAPFLRLHYRGSDLAAQKSSGLRRLCFSIFSTIFRELFLEFEPLSVAHLASSRTLSSLLRGNRLVHKQAAPLPQRCIFSARRVCGNVEIPWIPPPRPCFFFFFCGRFFGQGRGVYYST